MIEIPIQFERVRNPLHATNNRISLLAGDQKSRVAQQVDKVSTLDESKLAYFQLFPSQMQSVWR